MRLALVRAGMVGLGALLIAVVGTSSLTLAAASTKPAAEAPSQWSRGERVRERCVSDRWQVRERVLGGLEPEHRSAHV